MLSRSNRTGSDDVDGQPKRCPANSWTLHCYLTSLTSSVSAHKCPSWHSGCSLCPRDFSNKQLEGGTMPKVGWTAALMLGLSLGVSGAAAQTGAHSVEEIRKELMQLPYYGVFDFLAFKYDKG